MAISEDLIWKALKPHLGSLIPLDLNSYTGNQDFQNLVSDVARTLNSSDGQTTADLSDQTPSQVTMRLSETGGLKSSEYDALRAESEDYEYADADTNGRVMTDILEAGAYMGPTVRMRRRRAGSWEPVPSNSAPETESKLLWKFYWDCGRQGAVEGIFTATQSEIDSAIGREVHLGEVLGKHSDIYGVLEAHDFTLLSDDRNFIEKWVEIAGGSGICPLDFFD